MSLPTCKEVWLTMQRLIESESTSIRNFHQEMILIDWEFETTLFPLAALKTYTEWNLGKNIALVPKKYFNSTRGAEQGNYRAGMQQKIANVVDCLQKFPTSKRAVISISNNAAPKHRSDADAKCMREIILNIDNGKLNGTVFFRAQSAKLFPKNIHFIGSLMQEVASSLPSRPDLGTLFYLSSILIA